MKAPKTCVPRNITPTAPALLTSSFAYMDYCKLGEGVANAAFVGPGPAHKRAKGYESQPINESKCKDQEELTEKTGANEKEVTTYCRPLSDSYFCCPTLEREKICAITHDDLDPDNPTKVLTAFPCGHHFSKSLSEDPGPFTKIGDSRCVMCRNPVEYYYTGPLLFGKPHTLDDGLFGIQWNKIGEKYKGTFKMGSKMRGTTEFPNGDVYEGGFKDGEFDQGMYKWPNGTVYDGEFKNNEKHGQGTMKWLDGKVLTGEWKDDKMNGQGIYTWPDGQIYEGGFKDSDFYGQGTMKYADGNVYTGEWKDDKMNGRGKLTYFNGDVYTGKWKDGKLHGKGVYRFANGDVESHQYEDGKLLA